ncbi:hypothetical protein ES754_10840 [Psychrobacter frigidicola]|uniref:Uncharacterized protein n=1 Tax=Psychrobacter frigidicola TaxID=45611 RepID=A0A5C6ZYV0_9GAMM|nr:hypothetical protein [Psychrobacter frigidicola]TXD96125.1 hypothetical protein ES754_10840 [Psychrobacter frigidicola]
MEETMSSYSFSHQFYQHWTLAPEPIRAAIVQELTDINTLLQRDTQFEAFVFSEPDLDAYLEELYNTHKNEQAAANEFADKQAQQAVELQPVKEEEKEETPEKNTVEKVEKHIENEQQTKVENTTSITDKTSNNETTHKTQNSGSSNKAQVLSALQINSIPDIIKQGTTAETLPNAPKLSKDNEDLIHELGMHIDDYLSEQMAQLSEDLKSWLRNEITRQLSDKEQTATSTNKEQQ